MWYNKFRFTVNLLKISLIVSLVVLLVLLFGTYPGSVMVSLFYLVAAVFSFSFWTLTGFYLRKTLGQRELSEHYLIQAVRQGLWLTLILVFSLLLASFSLFSWINALFLVFVFVFLESYLLTKN